MSEHRKAAYGLQVQHGPNGTKVTRLEIYPAHLWWLRPSFRALYPSELWGNLFRVRVDGRWWWLKTKGSRRYPFFSHAEAWRVIGSYAAGLVGVTVPHQEIVAPDFQKGKLVIAHVEGLRTRTQIRREPWFVGDVWWVQVVGISSPVPLNALLSCNKVVARDNEHAMQSVFLRESDELWKRI